MIQPSASALFDSGVRFGIMCMMAGKAEINELMFTVAEMYEYEEGQYIYLHTCIYTSGNLC